MPPSMSPAVDHEKAVLGQMLGEAYQQALAMRIQMAMMGAAMADKDAQIAAKDAEIEALKAPPAEPAPQAENQ